MCKLIHSMQTKCQETTGEEAESVSRLLRGGIIIIGINENFLKLL